MGFLQIWLLWALPLALLPLVIHLVNRMRHRTVAWAAMRFLEKASRSSTHMAKIRQWIILLLRILACAALIAALARPLFGGWLGLHLAGSPDTVIILLDRSASMGARMDGGTETRLDRAVKTVMESARALDGSSAFVLIDSASCKPTQLPSPALLAELPAAAPTDAGANLPAMMGAALDYLGEHRTGRAEIWIASDLQTSSWQPEDPAWVTLAARVKAGQTQPQIKLLAVGAAGAEAAGSDWAVSLASLRTEEVPDASAPGGRKWRHEISFVIHPLAGAPSQAPQEKTLTLFDGVNRHPLKVKVSGVESRHRHRFETETFASPQAGYLELPADANAANNRAHFCLAQPPPRRALVVGDAGDRGTRLLALASAPGGAAAIVAPSALRAGDLRDVGLLVWDAPQPEPDLRRAVEECVASGSVLMLPPRPQGKWGEDVAWGGLEELKTPVKIASWEYAQGPFADTDSGDHLSLDKVAAGRRATFSLKPTPGAQGADAAQGATLAFFADGTPMAAHLRRGAGEVVVLATSLHPAWSNLGMGSVAVPMMRRLLAQGAQRLAPCSYRECADGAATAGVRTGESGTVVLNRPAGEDELSFLAPPAACAVMGEVPIRAFAAKTPEAEAIHTEIWRLFLVLMLALLAAEAFLLVPAAAPAKAAAGAGFRRKDARP